MLWLVGFVGEEGRLVNGLAKPRCLRWRDADLDLEVELDLVLFSLRLRERMRRAIGRGENWSGWIWGPTEEFSWNFSVLMLWGVWNSKWSWYWRSSCGSWSRVIASAGGIGEDLSFLEAV